jgi:hypothetical protein
MVPTSPLAGRPPACTLSGTVCATAVTAVAQARMGDGMQYFFFHLMPWPYLPDDFDQKYDSAWVWLSNALYDPAKGQQLYQEYINTLAYAEELGFDGVCVNEHHQNAYGLMPSPNVIAGALTQRTKRCKIAVIGNALPLYNPPLRVAEEFAMLDVLSGGRLVAGMVVGGGPEYFSYRVNPTTAREKFREATSNPP